MNPLISLKQPKSETNSSIWAIDSALLLESCGADAFGAPSKKNSKVCLPEFFEITRRANTAEIRKTQEIAGREPE